MAWLRARHDLDDERVLIGFVAGVLWLVGALVAAVAQMLPGAPHVDPVMFVTLDVAVVAYGLVSISGWLDWSRVTVSQHALASASLMPLLGVVLWATGGEGSYLQPLLVLALLHVAYFFSTWVSVALVAELIAVEVSPALYAHHQHPGEAAEWLALAVAATVLTIVLRTLKQRLVRAEARQRRMALTDPLTGLTNRRGFDETLHGSVARRGAAEGDRRASDAEPGFALVVFDLDRFKAINDSEGHPAGDALLCRVADGCRTVVRARDTLARVGGDEFAVIAPGSGPSGARRLAHDLLASVHAAGARATVAWALFPGDGADGEALLRAADHRLYERKHGRTPVAEHLDMAVSSAPQ
jgi:diguanylate cyclase (GGDEF)-like protein